MARDPIFDIFREEAREHLGALENLFLDLEAADSHEDRCGLIDNLFRHAHSLKGDAKVVGLVKLKDAAQALEDILDQFRSDPEQVDRDTINQGLAQFDCVRGELEAWQTEDLLQAAEETAADPSSDGAANVRITPAAVSQQIGDGAAGSKPLVAERPSSQHLPGMIPESAEASRAAASHASPADAGLSGKSAVAAVASTSSYSGSGPLEESFTVRVPSERLDRMLNLAGEVRISQSASAAVEARLADLSKQLSLVPRLESAADGEAWRSAVAVWQASLLDQFRRVQLEVRERSLREQRLVAALEVDIRQARLLPMTMLTDVLRRAVRDLSQSLHKTIQYEANVGKIMLDKVVIEALKDPLVHLVRNAADHGIESQEQRLSAGKPEMGTIRIDAWQLGQRVRIRVRDDGRGVDYERIRQKLIASGTVDAITARGLSERELARYLYQAGFTTATKGDVSGRGVGLDVVRDRVQRLHGTVELEAGSGAGTAFLITVPVTISTVRILTVLAGGQYYGIPSISLLRIGRAVPGDLRDFQGSLVLPLEGQPVRWVQLAELLGTTAPQAVAPQSWPYVLVKGPEGRLAVAVDELEDESEVLLKPLAFPLAGLPGMIGATIRADGSVQLVLDLSSSALGQASWVSARPPGARQAARRILVVDDSPTTRAVLRNVLTAAGYVIRTATDGMDALERLRTQPVDLIVCDVEMPRLNGLDFTRQVKSRYQLPVILVTGKEKEEHRREGLEAGADAYVVKSTFAGEGLLDVIKQLL